jgi:hypothetical protein
VLINGVGSMLAALREHWPEYLIEAAGLGTRTFASVVPAMMWTGLWLYFAAPLLGMMLAGEVYLQLFGSVYCAKLHHDNDKRCSFHHAGKWLVRGRR